MDVSTWIALIGDFCGGTFSSTFGDANDDYILAAGF